MRMTFRRLSTIGFASAAFIVAAPAPTVWASMISSATFATGLSGQDFQTGAQTRISLSNAKRGTVIVFLSAKCPCSASHEPALKTLFENFQTKGFTFVGIHANADESLAVSESHFKNGT